MKSNQIKCDTNNVLKAKEQHLTNLLNLNKQGNLKRIQLDQRSLV